MSLAVRPEGDVSQKYRLRVHAYEFTAGKRWECAYTVRRNLRESLKGSYSPMTRNGCTCRCANSVRELVGWMAQ